LSRAKESAGILLFRRQPGGLEVFLAHPGGPFWARRDEGVWTIPKGLVDSGEAVLAAARREFEEETGTAVAGEFIALGQVRMKSGKTVRAWAVEGDADPATVRSNTVSIEWPPHSGSIREYPEVDRCAWFDLSAAHRKIHPSQRPFLDRLAAAL
jgi:predicted NUDIX family NTP pyrophosphohydrolase